MSGLSYLNKDVGIDLGTANTLIYLKGKGIVLNEPSVVAIEEYSKNILAVGRKAKDMIGRTPGKVRAIRPLKDGVISDFEMTQVMLKEFIKMAIPTSSFFAKTRVVVGVPSGVTDVEKRAVEEAVYQSGAKHVFILDEPMAAAIGTGIIVDEARGSMIVDIGGGTTDIAVISLSGIVTSTSLRIAGDEMDEAIIQYIKKKYNLLIGDRTAEEIKTTIGCVYIDEDDPDGGVKSMEIRGRDLIAGLPRSVTVNSLEVMRAIEEPIKAIIDGVKTTLEKAPPELSADIIESGMVITGGGSLLRGFVKLMNEETGIDIRLSDNPLECVALGTGQSLTNIEKMKRYAKNYRRF